MTKQIPQVGDFIEIPVWNVIGCVLEVRAASIGPEDNFEVLQEHPDDVAGRQ